MNFTASDKNYQENNWNKIKNIMGINVITQTLN